MMVLFVICVRLPEILYQKTLEPKCPGISGVRQPYQLIIIKVLFLVSVAHIFPPGTGIRVVSGADKKTRGVSKRSTNESILGVYDDKSPCYE